ncbi:MAG TPA: hypothetical protein VD788_17480, partial [Candidatus Polarisedimenticolaceae bacterium]|nr:hypothetical protein [Candidatus Polarisedimenticolaceae bacterium]
MSYGIHQPSIASTSLRQARKERIAPDTSPVPPFSKGTNEFRESDVLNEHRAFLGSVAAPQLDTVCG